MRSLATKILYLAIGVCVMTSFYILKEILRLSEQNTASLWRPLSPTAVAAPEADGGFCVAILTGFPEVDRAPYLRRLLRSLTLQVAPPASRLDVHVFCQGDCAGEELLRNYAGTAHNLRELDADAERERRIRRHARFLCKDGCLREGRVPFVPGGDNSSIFSENRWFVLSQNYRRMFDRLFKVDRKSYCAIFEDDLVLSADSLVYLREGVRLMEADPSVFTISLNNDNSYPLYAADPRFFRRVSHFSGLGFVMSRRHYLAVLDPVWRANRNWDTVVQRALTAANMVSVQPEVTRSSHIRSRDYHAAAPPRDVFESQLLNDVITPDLDLSWLRRDRYDAFVAEFIRTGTILDHLEDSLFYEADHKLLYTNCSDPTDLDAILKQRHMTGSGNGGIVRGSYDQTLFIRIGSGHVLVVCRSSPIYARYEPEVAARARRRTRTHSGAKARLRLAKIRHTSSARVPRPLLGVAYALRRDYDVIVGARNQSCDEVCTARMSRCARAGLWLVNYDCAIMSEFCPVCGVCKHSAGIKPYIGVYPATDLHDVYMAFPHYLNCELASPQLNRVCPCVKQ